MMEEELSCTNCRRELDVGVEVIETQKGVVGMRGFVPLETLFFCSEKCLLDYFDMSDLPKVKRRIP